MNKCHEIRTRAHTGQAASLSWDSHGHLQPLEWFWMLEEPGSTQREPSQRLVRENTNTIQPNVFLYFFNCEHWTGKNPERTQGG